MMEDRFIIEPRGLGKDYYSHKIFCLMDDIIAFYDFLSINSIGTQGTILTSRLGISNIIYSSLQGTIESIKYLSTAGRLNDAFALARKFDDAVITDLYANILIKHDELKLIITNDNIKDILSSSKVRTWVLERKRLYNSGDKELEKVKNAIVQETDTELGGLIENYQSTSRKKCNDNVHYNSLTNFANNDCCYIGYKDRGTRLLDELFTILLDVFTKHFAYTYFLKPEIYSSYDYISALEEGVEPEVDSQYWVASIVQDVFDKYIKTQREDIANYLINNGIMKLA